MVVYGITDITNLAMKSRLTRAGMYLRHMSSQKSVWVMIVLFCVYFAFLAFARHNNFYSLRLDLGNMNQTVWNVSRGNGFTLTDPQGTAQQSRLAIHADFLLILLAPLYVLWSDPRLLILVQVVIVGLGALPVYWIAKDILRSETMGMFFAAAYLLYPSVERITVHDFHAVALSMSFLLFAYWFMYKKKWVLFVVFAALAAFGKEHIWITTGLMGIYIALREKKFRWVGIVTAGMSFFIFYYLIWKAIPSVAPEGQHFALSYLSDFGDTQNSIVRNLLLHPFQVLRTLMLSDRLQYYIRLLFPVAMLPIFSPFALLFGAPSLLINALSNNALMRIIDYQYTSDITPFLFVSAIKGYAVIASAIQSRFRGVYRRRGNAILLIAFIACVAWASVSWGELPYGRQSRFYYFMTPLPEKAVMQQVEAAVKPMYTVSATNNIGAHFSGREFLYAFPVNALSSDFVIAKLGDQYAWPSGEEQEAMVDRLLHSPDYTLFAQQNDFYAFKKKNINDQP